MAEDLPRTKLSEYLETHVRDKLKDKMAEMAKEMAELKVSIRFPSVLLITLLRPSI